MLVDVLGEPGEEPAELAALGGWPVGQQDQAIAARLHISARTVQTHLAHVYAKLGITSRTELSRYLG